LHDRIRIIRLNPNGRQRRECSRTYGPKNTEGGALGLRGLPRFQQARYLRERDGADPGQRMGVPASVPGRQSLHEQPNEWRGHLTQLAGRPRRFLSDPLAGIGSYPNASRQNMGLYSESQLRVNVTNSVGVSREEP
jgi:hypothetical protein